MLYVIQKNFQILLFISPDKLVILPVSDHTRIRNCKVLNYLPLKTGSIFALNMCSNGL